MEGWRANWVSRNCFDGFNMLFLTAHKTYILFSCIYIYNIILFYISQVLCFEEDKTKYIYQV